MPVALAASAVLLPYAVDQIALQNAATTGFHSENPHYFDMAWIAVVLAAYALLAALLPAARVLAVGFAGAMVVLGSAGLALGESTSWSLSVLVCGVVAAAASAVVRRRAARKLTPSSVHPTYNPPRAASVATRSRPVTAGAALAAVPGHRRGTPRPRARRRQRHLGHGGGRAGPGRRGRGHRLPADGAGRAQLAGAARGGRALAWILMVAGGCSGIATLSTVVAQVATEPSTATDVAVMLLSSLWVPGFLSLLTLVPLFYPDGLLPGEAVAVGRRPRRRRTRAADRRASALYPETFEGRIRLPKPVSHLGVAQGLTVRRRGDARAGGPRRPRVARRPARPDPRTGAAQVIVFLAAAGLLIAVTVAQGLLPPPVGILAQAVAAALVPVAIGVAITRHGLYELDVAVRRSLVAVSLGTCLAGGYLTLFAVLQALPGTSRHSAQPSPPASPARSCSPSPSGSQPGSTGCSTATGPTPSR